jgi:aspartyl/asparaginyl-tRNA synthetase
MHTIPIIDYQKIADAARYYESCGFTEISVPWIVSYEAYSITKPTSSQDFYTLEGYLNASGEQSFIQMLLEEKKLSKQFCITPCFRYETVLDEIHYRYFMKLELIDTDVSKENLQKILTYAKKYFMQHTEVTIIQTDVAGEAFDILDTHTGIELGSYGIRRTSTFEWVYGTGVALPRLQVVLEKNNS